MHIAILRQLRFHSSFVLTRTFSVSSMRITAYSHHRYFIDSRRIICIRHLCRTFVNFVYTLLRQTSADFCELSDTLRIVPLMPVAVLEQAFQGVTPSFHLSKYQFFETDLLSLFNHFVIEFQLCRMPLEKQVDIHAVLLN
jgi:hypothetical protein